MNPKLFFVIDVESIGLHGDGYAVGGCILDLETGSRHSSFCISCEPWKAKGVQSDRDWIAANVPAITVTDESPRSLRDTFWREWESAKVKFPGIVMAAECGWPVEANFLEACIKDDEKNRRFSGPYPLHEIASFMQAAGMDPMATYERDIFEEPKHNPRCDALQSARLLHESICKITVNQ